MNFYSMKVFNTALNLCCGTFRRHYISGRVTLPNRQMLIFNDIELPELIASAANSLVSIAEVGFKMFQENDRK